MNGEQMTRADDASTGVRAGRVERPAPSRLRYLQAPTRRELILSRMRLSGFTSISDLAVELGVSEMTIRRDVRRLELAGEVRLVHGGVSLAHATLRTSEFTSRAGMSAAAKARIAATAVGLIQTRDVVGFDAGSTAFEVAAHLPVDFAGSVITHSVPVVQHLLNLPAARVTGLGGELYGRSQAFIGSATVQQLHGLRMRLFFLGAAAVDQHGIYVEADLEIPTKTALIDAASVVIVVVDHHKFDHPAPVLLCPLERVDTIITDEPVGPVMTSALRAAQVALMIAT